MLKGEIHILFDSVFAEKQSQEIPFIRNGITA